MIVKYRSPGQIIDNKKTCINCCIIKPLSSYYRKVNTCKTCIQTKYNKYKSKYKGKYKSKYSIKAYNKKQKGIFANMYIIGKFKTILRSTFKINLDIMLIRNNEDFMLSLKTLYKIENEIKHEHRTTKDKIN